MLLLQTYTWHQYSISNIDAQFVSASTDIPSVQINLHPCEDK